MNASRFQEIAGRFSDLSIAVVGDFCLDRYLEIDPAKQETSIETTLTGEWIVHESVWRFATCPNAETIVLTAPPTSALIDQIVVDTFCATPPVCPTDITGDADPGLCVKTGITWSLPAADGPGGQP